ncbi:MAG TPA: HTTM domain-containing protein [Bdellovibrionales bacterium]|nr:HTTM domain-containing protein [Bdellovibrionales bacterium]
MSERLIAFAVFWQALEMLSLRRWWSDRGVWSRARLKLPRVQFGQTAFTSVLVCMTGAALWVMIRPNGIGLLWLAIGVWLIAIRWRGSFNGGSDAMTFHVLAACAVAGFFPSLRTMALWYIAIQSCLSYFVAGLVKLRRPGWRDGSSLNLILLHSPSSKLRMEVPAAGVWTWLAMLFELSFPLALLDRRIALGMIVLGTGFHLSNFRTFGLNRFFWAWVSTYPAIFAVSGSVKF